ncbi:transmembrane and coiled-coil domain-containing protein 2 [Petaurus breviceps papuanus]|uniref:transmembrane and coiled-coil domain-containing protein 2 n=1 Tax=Petaurus breviceps papuanus TaxID=3040969 RepID=UPI0036D8ACF6
MDGTTSPFTQTSGFFSLTPLWNWLQENKLTLNSDCWLSEHLPPTWQAIFWIILAFCLLIGTCAFWKRTLQSVKKIIIFINLVLLLYKKGTDLFQDILSNSEGTNHCTMSQGNNDMLVTLSLQEKMLRKLQMVEGKVKDLEDLILTYKGGKKNCTRPHCSCSDCQSPLASSGFTSTSEA